jgi:16S rRNA (cytosine1402-N4)-methyltransferase
MAPANDDLSHHPDRTNSIDLTRIHRPVMLAEVLAHLPRAATDGGAVVLVDGTLGLGGHAEALLERCTGATLLGLDRDGEALALAARRLARFGARVRTRHASYAGVAEALAAEGLAAPTAVLLDLGVSSLQLDDARRGFSFRAGAAAPDMRFDRDEDVPDAAAWVNQASEEDLARVLFEHGQEPRARAVARAIVRGRPYASVDALAQVVRRAALRTKRIDAATRTFQALRMAVNDEPGHLARGLEAALRVLAPEGRLLVLAFHSGEERLVKAAFRAAGAAGRGRVLTKKPLRAGEGECRENPRARPARLRVFEVGPDGSGDGGVGEDGRGRVGGEAGSKTHGRGRKAREGESGT